MDTTKEDVCITAMNREHGRNGLPNVTGRILVNWEMYSEVKLELEETFQESGYCSLSKTDTRRNRPLHWFVKADFNTESSSSFVKPRLSNLHCKLFLIDRAA